MMAFNQPRKKKIVLEQKMKPLYWKRVLVPETAKTTNGSKPVWADLKVGGWNLLDDSFEMDE